MSSKMAIVVRNSSHSSDILTLLLIFVVALLISLVAPLFMRQNSLG